VTWVWLASHGDNGTSAVITNGIDHEAILQHPDAEIPFDRISIPPRALLVFSTGSAPNCVDVSAGAHVAVEATEGRTTTRVFSRTMDPVSNARDRHWINTRSDLSPWSGEDTALTFISEVDNRRYRCAWALWGIRPSRLNCRVSSSDTVTARHRSRVASKTINWLYLAHYEHGSQPKATDR
jgi:hypothetical protein